MSAKHIPHEPYLNATEAIDAFRGTDPRSLSSSCTAKTASFPMELMQSGSLPPAYSLHTYAGAEQGAGSKIAGNGKDTSVLRSRGYFAECLSDEAIGLSIEKKLLDDFLQTQDKRFKKKSTIVWMGKSFIQNEIDKKNS